MYGRRTFSLLFSTVFNSFPFLICYVNRTAVVLLRVSESFRTNLSEKMERRGKPNPNVCCIPFIADLRAGSCALTTEQEIFSFFSLLFFQNIYFPDQDSLDDMSAFMRFALCRRAFF